MDSTLSLNQLLLIERYPEYLTIIDSPVESSSLVFIVLYDSRVLHQNVTTYLKQSRTWLAEQALQTGIDIALPLRTSKREFQNPSALICRDLGIKSNELPGYLLVSRRGELGGNNAPHSVYLPRVDLDFSNLAAVQQDQALLFSQIQEVQQQGHQATEVINQIRAQSGLPPVNSSDSTPELPPPTEPSDQEKQMADLFGLAMDLMEFETPQVIGMAGNKVQSGNAPDVFTQIAGLAPDSGNQWRETLNAVSATAPPAERASLALDIFHRSRCSLYKIFQTFEGLDYASLPHHEEIAQILKRWNALKDPSEISEKLEEASREVLAKVQSSLAGQTLGWAEVL